MTNVIVSALLIAALQFVESTNNPRAIGDGGRYVGVLQIGSVVIEDVNRIRGTSYEHSDAYDPYLSKVICRRYLEYWGGIYYRKTGKVPTDEVLARIWGGGPNGWDRAATEWYWKWRVKPAMRTLKGVGHDNVGPAVAISGR